MDRLLSSILDIASNTPPDKLRQLATRIRKIDGPDSCGTLKSWATTPVARERLDNLFTWWQDRSLSSEELAGMLIGASHAYNHVKAESEIDLVWTGPSSELVATRKTEQALLQVIKASKKKLFLTSFVAYDVASVMAAFEAALARNVEISMLLESSDAHGGGVSIDGIGRMKKALPDAKIYYWGEKLDTFAGGKVHAKVAVADEAICFLSSANLTGHAMEKNMEAGVLIRGGAIPVKLQKHLEALVTTKTLTLA